MEVRLDAAELGRRSNQSSNFVNKLDSDRVVATAVFPLVAIRFQTTSTEIAGTKIAWETGDDVIVLLIV